MKNDKHIDEELVLAYQAGNKKAMAKLVKRWHLIFCKKAFWTVKDASLSKDIAQESWQIIMKKLHTLQNPSSFKPWALRIVYTKSIDTLRENQINSTVEYNHNEEYEVNEFDTQNDLKKILLKGIKSLPEQQQMVLKLFYTEDYSLKEISEFLNISVGTTKSRLFHAREKLKLILKPMIGDK